MTAQAVPHHRPGVVRRIWRDIALPWRGVTRREAWGYGVLAAVALVVGIPEIRAAIKGDRNEWPTISGTIAHLEYFHNWVAIIVIGVIVWSAFQAYRIPSTHADSREEVDKSGTKSISGGWLASPEDVKTVNAAWYFAVAVAAVVGGSLLTAETTSDRYTLGYVLYALIAFFWLLLPGWLAWRHKRLVPFPSIFATVKDLERRVRPVAAVIVAGLAVLLIHLVLYPWPAIIPDLKDQHGPLEKQRQHPATPAPPTARPTSPPAGAS